MKRIAINGFGRIGRAFFRVAFGRPELEIVAVNDPFFTTEMARYLLVHDSIYGRFDHEVRETNGGLEIDGKSVPLLSEREPSNLPWAEMGVDLVVESTGVFLTPEKAALHLQGGARRVLLSAPPKGDGILQVVYGVNHEAIEPSMQIVSAASCTTNSFVPVMYVLETEIGVEHALLTTVHGYTGDQRLVDAPHSKPSRARAAAINIIPTTTGAAQATTKILPSLDGKMDGIAFRVPVPTGSVSDVTVELSRDIERDEINALFRSYAGGKLAGVLGTSDDPMVSSDTIGDDRPSIVDLTATRVVDKRFLKVMAFYDNEWGYTNQLLRVALAL
jgi:glyceraldehyde 3-phosphate dehydrogenase